MEILFLIIVFAVIIQPILEVAKTEKGRVALFVGVVFICFILIAMMGG
jgi:hypothetical protein